jgi:pyridoxamine 5'-phosphate oxidase
MDKGELISIAKDVLADSKAAILTTVGKDGVPAMRWMSPIFLRNFEDSIYAVTSVVFNKTSDLKLNNKVQWMIQSKNLNRIINFNGEVSLVEDVALRSEVIEKLGTKLHVFWTINKDPSNLIVLETRISTGVIFLPIKGRKEIVSFSGEALR